MATHHMVIVFSLVCSTTTCLNTKCKTCDCVNPNHGQYCPTEGITVPNFSFNQCKLCCLQTICEAINYNHTGNTCTKLTATCPKAVNHPGMALVLFTGRQPEQCFEWIPKQNGDPVGDRSLTEDSKRFVARLQKGGNDLVCYLFHKTDNCISRDENGREVESLTQFPCQYLRVLEGCTVMYVDYKLGTPLPPNVLIGGYTTDRIPVYIALAIFDDFQLPGCYRHGSKKVIAGYRIATENIKILISLWTWNFNSMYWTIVMAITSTIDATYPGYCDRAWISYFH